MWLSCYLKWMRNVVNNAGTCHVCCLCQRGDDTMTIDRLAILSTPRAGRMPPKSDMRSTTLRRDCSVSTQSLAMSPTRRLVSFTSTIITTHSELQKVLFFGVVRLWPFLFVYEISLEPLDGFAPNPHGRHVWSLARMSLKVKVKGHQGQKMSFFVPLAACVWFVFGKTSLASSCWMISAVCY